MRDALPYLLAVALLLASAWDATGQSEAERPELRFQRFDTEDGLSQNMVDCLLQDRYGFLWIGTWNGLCKYDGYRVEVYNDQRADGLRLGNNFVYALHEDGYGNVWVGTQEGLYRYRYADQRFGRVSDLQNGLGPRDEYHALAGAGEGRMLVGSGAGVALLALDSAGDYAVEKRFPFDQSGSSALRGTVVHALLRDRQGQVWIGTDEGLYRFGPSFERLAVYRAGSPGGLSSDAVLSLFQAEDGALWVGTETGLNRYRPSSDSFEAFFHAPDDERSLAHSTVMDIAEDRQGRLLLATLGGLSVMEKSVGRFLNYRSRSGDELSLGSDFLNALLVDRDGALWVGSERGGVSILSARQNGFRSFKAESGSPNSLAVSTVNAIYKDERFLWVGTAGGGLDRMRLATGEFDHFRHRTGDAASLSSDFATSILKDSRGRVWVGTWGQGLNRLDDSEAERFEQFNEVNSGLPSNFVSSILEGPQGALWIGTLGGLACFDPETGAFERIAPVDNKFDLRGVGCLSFDGAGQLWVGTQHGLFRLDPRSPRRNVKAFYHAPGASGSISNDYVISLHEDRQGAIWAGTYGQGINRIAQEGEGFHVRSYNHRNGLPNDIVYAIEEDAQGRLWLSTDYGLCRFDPETETSRNFFVHDGLQNNQYYWSASFKDERGTLYFGGMNGIDVIRPERVSDDRRPPKATLTALKLSGEAVTPRAERHGVRVLDGILPEARQATLSYRERALTLEFSTFDYLETDQIGFAYQLERFDRQWNHVRDGRHSATYTNLSPGLYRFKVKAAGPNGAYGPTATLAIRILPPFWETWWFRSLLVVLLAAAIWGYTRYRVFALRKQKIILGKIVARRTAEIEQQKEALGHQAVQLKQSNAALADKQKQIEGQNRELEASRDQLIALNERLEEVSRLRLSFFTNISHEFRTPLTLIVGPLGHLLRRERLPAEVRASLETVNRNAKRLLHLINEIMDFRKLEQGQVKLESAPGDFGAFCQEVAAAFAPLAEVKGVRFEVEVAALPERLHYDALKLEDVLYNLLSNAFKYTPEGGFVRMEAKAMPLEASRLTSGEGLPGGCPVMSLTVTDSGPGISEEHLPFVFKRFYRVEGGRMPEGGSSGVGLAIAEELTRLHRGALFVSSQAGKGSTFEAQFPCLRFLAKGGGPASPAKSGGIRSRVEALREELAAREAPAPRPAEPEGAEGRPCVLVVEDNADLRGFLAHRLRERYRVIEAADGLEGAERAKAHEPDAIVSDVMMPGQDGFALCAALKADLATSHIPVVLLTAKSSVEHQIEGFEAGADDYLPKPFNFELLETRIENLIESRKRLRQRFAGEPALEVGAFAQSAKDREFLERAAGIVEERMEDPDFGAKELVAALGMSRSLVHKKLTALTSQSTTEFINRLRVRKARLLLERGGANVSEVAYSVGYNDPKYFSRVFRKIEGKPPKEVMNA